MTQGKNTQTIFIMKRDILLYAGCLLAGALTASCSSDDEPLVFGEYPLQIGTATVAADGAASRVAETDDGTGSQWTDGKTGTYTLNADGSVKTADTPVYWQSRAAQTVTAWYPATDGAIDLSDQTEGLKYVLKATAENMTFSDAVSLDFRHQLAKVRVKLSGDKADDVTAVAVKGCTSFSVKQGAVGEAANEGYIKMMKATYSDGDYYEANLTPQTISADDFVQVTADGKTYICKMNCNATNVEAGHAYTLKAVVLMGDKPYADLDNRILYTFAEGQIADTPDIIATAMSNDGYLKIVGPISQDDLNTIISEYKSTVVDLDMSEAYGTDLKIPSMCFRGSETLTSIKLPDGVTNIGGNAFWCCI